MHYLVRLRKKWDPNYDLDNIRFHFVIVIIPFLF